MRESRVQSESVEVDLTGDSDLLSSTEPSSKSAEVLANQKKEQGNKLFVQGSYAEAVKAYTEAIGLCAQPAYFTNRSQCWFRLGNFESALKDAAASVQLDPTFGKGYLRMAGCNIVFGDFEAAEKNLQLAEKNMDAKGLLDVAKERTRLQTMCKYVSEVEKCWCKSDWRGVVYYSTQVIDAAPKMYSMVTRKAEALVYNKKVDDALNLMADVLRMDDKHVDAIFIRGLCFYYQENFDKASAHFKRALQLNPDHSKAKTIWNRMKTIKSKKEEAGALLKSGKVREALALYTQVLAVDPTNDQVNSRIHFNIAVCHSKLKDPKVALHHLNVALSLDAGYVKAGMKRVQVYMELEMFEEAVREAEDIFKREKSQIAKTLVDEAKLALKKSQQKDYYKILGIGKTASDDEIKKAYKKKALVHHPDRHANSSEVEKKDNEKKFKDLGEAYAVLSDKSKRMRYDSGQDSQACAADFGHFDPTDIFASFFAGGGGNFANMGGQSFNFSSGGGGGGPRFSYQ